jgi:AraC family transcriptional regulator of arabinose operon
MTVTPEMDLRSTGAARGAKSDVAPGLGLRRVFLQGATASMSTAFETWVSKVSRHDVVIRLTADGSPFDAHIGDHRGPLQVAVIPPMMMQSVKSRGPGFISLMLHVIHPRFRTARAFLDGRLLRPARADFAHLDERLHALCHGPADLTLACDVMDGLLDAVLAGARRAPPVDLRIPWVMRKLDVDIDYPFEQLAAELGLSCSRLSHLFTQELGLSFRSYQIWARLRQAWERLMQCPELSVTDVARIMGYADAAHFSRTFHNGLGFTPTMARDARFIEVVGDGLPRGQHIPSDQEMSRA